MACRPESARSFLVAVAVCTAVFVFQKRYRVSEVYVRHVAETVIAVRTAQFRHMSETVVWRFVFLVSIDILHFKALMTSVATPWIRSSCRLSNPFLTKPTKKIDRMAFLIILLSLYTLRLRLHRTDLRRTKPLKSPRTRLSIKVGPGFCPF